MVVELSKDFQTRYNKLIFPKPQYRNSRTGARSTRTQIDHDVFEGLPVRHWRKRTFNVSTSPEKDTLDLLGTGDTGWPELPMPRDAHMYSPMSEALLRAARMGQVKKPATPLMDDEKEPGEDEDADGDLDMGFVAKRWSVVPKDMEGPEPEFLAKRRKGLPSVYTGATGPFGSTPQMRKTKIRKVDTEGNSYIWEVLLPEGQAVDGEIVEEETSPTQAPAPGTVVEGLGVVNAEGVVIAGDQAMPVANRRRPPPPKRKAKGPGRGRKKKVSFTTDMEGPATSNGFGAMPNGSGARANDGESARREHRVPDGDTEMGDENVLQEGEEGSEEGSEGDDGEDGDREEGELSPSPTPPKSPAEPPTIIVNEISLESAAITHDAAPSPSKVQSAVITYDTAPSPSKVPFASPNEPTREDSPDPMLLDEDDNEPMSNSFSEPTMPPVVQSTDPTVNVVPPVTDNVSEERMHTPESISRPSEAVVTAPYVASIAEPQAEIQVDSVAIPPPDSTSQSLPNPVGQSIVSETSESLDERPEQPMESLAESLTRPGTPAVPPEYGNEGVTISTTAAMADLVPDTLVDIIEEAVLKPGTDNLSSVITERVPESSTGESTSNNVSMSTTQSTTELREERELKFSSEISTKDAIGPAEAPDPVASQLVDEQPLAEQSISAQPLKEEPMTEPPAAAQSVKEHPVTEQSITEHPVTEQSITAQPVTEPSTIEQPVTEQPMIEPIVTEQVETEQAVIEESVKEQSDIAQPIAEQTTTEQYMAEHFRPEPWARPATEPVPEAISPERRFSYTRVTTSPQAPTPSPPTPIESTFGLKAPYLSPKAPTMSPPTPIGRSMSSSPDIPLADQHFRLPPQIDAAQEADQVSATDTLYMAGADHTSEAAPSVDTRVKDRASVEHDALLGLAEPRVAEESEGSTQHFTDGEEDLLGSLERSLGKHGSGGS